MSDDRRQIDRAREAVREQVLSARTLDEIDAARDTLRAWLAAHPDDHGMRFGFNQLSRMRHSQELAAAGRVK